MNSCLICDRKDLTKLTKINECTILECQNCKLSLTKDKTKSDKEKLYKTSKLYNKDDYLRNSDQQVKKIKWIVNKISNSIKSGTILDVGAGFGLLSSELIKMPNLNIEALEPNLPLSFIQKEKSVKKHKIDYENFLKTSPTNFYDAILFVDVFEHFPNPKSVLINTNKILKPDGKVFINLPNYNSIMRKLVKNWSWWMVEDHYYHFSQKSLVKFFTKNGYKVDFIRTYESYRDFKSNLDGNFAHINNSLVRKLIKIIYFSLFIPAYFIVRHIFWNLGYGGLIFMIVSKKYE